MTEISDSRRRLLLPLLNSVRHGSRSHTTCYYKCGNACDAAVPNRTDNPTFESVVQTVVSRRALLKAAGAGALVVAANPLFPEPAAATPGRRGAARGPMWWPAALFPATRRPPRGRAVAPPRSVLSL